MVSTPKGGRVSLSARPEVKTLPPESVQVTLPWSIAINILSTPFCFTYSIRFQRADFNNNIGLI